MFQKISHGTPEYDLVLELRDRVLRKPLGLVFTPEQIAAESDEVILADFREGLPAATLQFQVSDTEWKMRQVAVARELQGGGIGGRLVRFSEDWALRSGARTIVLHARDTAVPFYTKLGYSIVGSPFEEVGIPHCKMTKDLTRPFGFLPYVEAFPEEIRAALKEKPLAILPWGALEWHGSHLPAGLDGLVAEEFAKRLAARTGGVLLPTMYLPITTLPHPVSIDISTAALRLVLDELFRGLAKSRFKAALLVSGHYAQGHEWELYEAAERAAGYGLKVLAASPLEVLEEDGLLDHAGRWEAACLSMFRPDLLRLEVLEGKRIQPTVHAVLGETPLEANPIEGWEAMDRAWTQWNLYSRQLLEGDTSAVTQFYERRRKAYQAYRDRYYRTSWEQAIQDWWADKQTISLDGEA